MKARHLPRPLSARMPSRSFVAGVFAVAMLLAGCDAGVPAAPTDADVRAAEARRPQDPQLAAKYERSCLLCHGVRSGAPLVGFAPAWKPRVAQGEGVLLARVRDGFNAMPAMGLCTDCSDAELRQLIDFVIQGK